MRTGRFNADTMPEVTVADRPSGEPTATTPCPTCRSAEVPRVAGVSPDTPAALITARSSVGSAPTTAAVAVVPSLNCTCRLVAPVITWLFVRISPSADRMTPEPSPALLDEDDNTDTTDGNRVAATCSTEPSGAAARFADTTGADDWGKDPLGLAPVRAAPDVNRPWTAAPAKPPTTANTTVATVSSVLRRPCPDRVASTAGGVVWTPTPPPGRG